MSEINPSPELKALIQRGIFEIESGAAEIADFAHPTSSVNIEIEDHHPVTGTLPDELLRYFARNNVPATAVSGVNVSADFVDSEHCFAPVRTEIMLDEGTSLEFSQSPTLARMKLHHFQILHNTGPDKKGPKLSTQSSVLADSEFKDVMERMQLDIPVGNDFELSAITKSLQFTERWKVTFDKVIPLNPHHVVRIEDSYFKSIRDEGRIAFGYTPQQQWSRTLKIGQEIPLDGFIVPSSTTQLVLTSGEANTTPRYSRILDMPLTYEPEEDDLLLSAFVEHPLMLRREDVKNSQTVNPTIPLLDGFHKAINSVRIALEQE